MVETQELADVVAQAIDMATAPLLARIAVLEKRALVHGRDGRDGTDGKDALLPDLDLIAQKAATLIPKPADGKDASLPDLDVIALKAAALIPRPADGKDAPPADLDVIALKAAALIPKPADGADGKDAPLPDLDLIATKAAALIPAPRDGRDGSDGRDADVSDVKSELATLRELWLTKGQVSQPVLDLDAIAVKAAALVPVPVNGRDGADGRDGTDGKDGRDGIYPDDRVTALEQMAQKQLSSEAIVPTFVALAKGLLADVFALPPPVMQKRIVRTADGQIERVIEEPAT